MSKSKQLSFLPKQKRRREHGGSLAVRKRRSLRPLNLRQTHHITMKSHHAFGAKSLFRHKKMILSLFKKFSNRFNVMVIEYAIQGNHMHLLVKAQNRESLQNFFRVIAGHSAQKILQISPLAQAVNYPAGGAPAREVGKGKVLRNKRQGCKKNQRRFWSYLLYSRIVSWGRDFKAVVNYIQKNIGASSDHCLSAANLKNQFGIAGGAPSPVERSSTGGAPPTRTGIVVLV